MTDNVFRPPALEWLTEVLEKLRKGRVKSATLDHVGRLQAVEFFAASPEVGPGAVQADPRVAAFEALEGMLPKLRVE